MYTRPYSWYISPLNSRIMSLCLRANIHFYLLPVKLIPRGIHSLAFHICEFYRVFKRESAYVAGGRKRKMQRERRKIKVNSYRRSRIVTSFLGNSSVDIDTLFHIAPRRAMYSIVWRKKENTENVDALWYRIEILLWLFYFFL